MLGSGVFIEGWAVYSEWMMVEEGFLDGDPLMQLIVLKWYLRDVTNATGSFMMASDRNLKSGLEAWDDYDHPFVAKSQAEFRRQTFTGFCRELAARGYRVIRYDNRDTGFSTKFDGQRVLS